jgi:hypothetical protein
VGEATVGDSPDMQLPPELRASFEYAMSWTTGLKPEHVRRAKPILHNGQNYSVPVVCNMVALYDDEVLPINFDWLVAAIRKFKREENQYARIDEPLNRSYANMARGVRELYEAKDALYGARYSTIVEL